MSEPLAAILAELDEVLLSLPARRRVRGLIGRAYEIGRAAGEAASGDRVAEVRQIQTLAARQFGIAEPVLLGKSLNSALCRARQAAILVCIDHRGVPTSAVARGFGRDRSTIWWALQVGRRRLCDDIRFDAAVAALADRVGALSREAKT